MAAVHKRRWRNYLLDRTYQLRYTGAMVAICAVLLGVLGYHWHGEMRTASDIVEVKVLTEMREADAQRVQDELAAHDRLRLVVLLGVGVLLCLSIAGFTIVYTHRVAGPLHVLQRAMDGVAEGHYRSARPLRKGDHLADFADAFQRMTNGLREAASKDLASTEAAIAQLEDGSADAEATAALDELRRLQQRLADRLGEPPEPSIQGSVTKQREDSPVVR